MQMRGLTAKNSSDRGIGTRNRSSNPQSHAASERSLPGKIVLKALLPRSNPAAKPDTRQFFGAIWRLKPSKGQLAVPQIPSKELPCPPALGPHS